MYKAKITAKGQLTLPKKLRDKIGVETGDYLEVHETEAGYLIKKQVNEDRFKKYVGILHHETDSDQVVKELREG